MTNVEFAAWILKDVHPIHIPTFRKKLAPEVGLEPTTHRLTADCSTIELLWNSGGRNVQTDCLPSQTIFSPSNPVKPRRQSQFHRNIQHSTCSVKTFPESVAERPFGRIQCGSADVKRRSATQSELLAFFQGMNPPAKFKSRSARSLARRFQHSTFIIQLRTSNGS